MKKTNPPWLPFFILKSFKNFSKRFDLLMELEDEFDELVDLKGEKYANKWYWQNFINIIPVLFKESFLWRISMFTNYIKMAIRTINKHKIFSFINILGLALGISICLFVIKFTLFMHSYDNFHQDAERIYLIGGTISPLNGATLIVATNPAYLPEILEKECPNIESTVRIENNKNKLNTVSYSNRKFTVEGLFAGENFFSFFNFALIEGNKEQVLSEPNKVVISENLSKKLFGNENPIRKIIMIGDSNYVEISGIMENIPKNSCFTRIEMLVSYKTRDLMLSAVERNLPDSKRSRLWNQVGFIKLNKNSTPKELENLINKKVIKFHENGKAKYSFYLTNISNLAFEAEFKSNALAGGIPYWIIIVFIALAACILIIACFNYTNLSAAKALSRLKEIGIRKVTGASRKSLFVQFIGESIIISLFALILAFIFQKIITSLFIGIHPEMSRYFGSSDNFTLIIWFIAFAFLTGILSGFLPALLLSKLTPISILNNSAKVKIFSGMNFKKLLIVGQITISLFFIICTVSAYRQYYHTKNIEMGFEPENVLNISLKGDSQLFIQKIKNHPKITYVSAVNDIPGLSGFGLEGSFSKAGAVDSINADYSTVQYNFLSSLKIKFLAGNDFIYGNDSLNKNLIIINKMLCERLGYGLPLNAIGQSIKMESNNYKIIGVVDNFMNRKFYNVQNPTAIIHSGKNNYYVSIKHKAGYKDEVLNFAKEKWSELYPGTMMIHKTFVEKLEEKYEIIEMPLKILSFVSIMAIFISCLGLLGIVMYNANSRIKEVAIHKIVGASLMQIIKILSREYIKLFIISTAIAAPLAWFLNTAILQNLPDRAEFGFIEILSSLIILIILGSVTIISQTLRVAKSNPVENLRHD